MAPGSPRTPSEKLETWLRYYDDLGIRLFYRDRGRDRAPVPETAAQAAQVQVFAATEASVVKQPSGATPSVPSFAAGQRPTTPASIPRVQVQGSVHGLSLFEAAERVVGDTLERICGDLGDC